MPKHITPPKPEAITKPFGTIHPNSTQFKKEMENISDLYSKTQTSDTTNQFKKEMKKAKRQFNTYKSHNPDQPTPTNSPRFLSILSYLKHTFRPPTSLPTKNTDTPQIIHINPLIEDHLQLLKQCQNTDEQADVLHELYQHGYTNGKRDQLKRSKN